MATKFYKFTGTGEWFKIFQPDEYLGKSRYILNFYPDDKQAIKEAGIQLRYDRATNSYIRPRREVSKKFKDEIVEFGRPEVVDKDGNEWVSEEMGYIGNGTKVELTISVYDTKNYGKGHRLEKVRILDLVQYEKSETEPQKEERAAEPTVKTTTAKAKKSGIPF